MRRIPFVSSLLMATVSLLTITGCQNDTTPNNPGTGGLTSTPEARAFAQKTNDFSFDFLKRVNEDQKKDENIFVSPLSLHMALGMLLNGAAGQTADEMKKAMHLEGVSLADANQTYEFLLKGLPTADPKVTTKLANSIWYRNGFSVEPSYLDVTKKTFNAQISGEDFNNPTPVINKINQWASDNTNARIKNVIQEIKPEQVLFLLNALYFKGDWKYQFETKNTFDSPFTLVSGLQKQVKMMNMTTSLRHAFRPTYGAFELPYGDGTYSMTVLVPTENSSADAIINTLNATEWADLQQAMRESKVAVGLPKFTMEYEATLNDALSRMGMPSAFSNAANFSGISTGQGLQVSYVKQNTYVAVDEKGTEAAAVTSIGVEVTSAGPSLICDRPFVFLITEKGTGSVLFMGKIVNPETTLP
ncbi:serpin family protein [Larkinella punicea]|uniref:Serpin family protein n=1 Tax=Larkinella punicea TaxID=2315727 RepID=A0A368JMS8_9BACT|nr:serpin family protein [Larkinella punicea]RCR67964.1 serpin family protein [Larkinella punicea]